MIEEFSLQVRQKRGGMGIRAAAADIGISPATLSRIEAGKQPDLTSFRRICNWLKVDPGEILGMKTSLAKTSVEGHGQIQAHFRANKAMSPVTAQNLADLIITIQKASEKGL